MVTPDPVLSEYFLSEDDLDLLMDYLRSDRPAATTLLAFADEVALHAGDVVIGQGERDASLFILTEGSLAVIVDDGEHQRTAVTIEPYALVGEQSFIDGEPRTATVIARTDAVVHRLTAAAFERVRAERPDLACALLVDVARTLSRRCRALAQR